MIGNLIKYVKESLPNENRQDVLWRHAILSRQLGQFVGISMTHDPKLAPDAHPMTGLEEAGADLLVQTFYTMEAAGLDIDRCAAIALDRMQSGVWKRSQTQFVSGLPSGILAHPWKPGDIPLKGYVCEWDSKHEARHVPYILLKDHVDNDFVPYLKKMVDNGVVRALITRHGGMTSHAATVCRELDIPCVVGIGDAKIAHGDQVKLVMDRRTQRVLIELVA